MAKKRAAIRQRVPLEKAKKINFTFIFAEAATGFFYFLQRKTLFFFFFWPTSPGLFLYFGILDFGLCATSAADCTLMERVRMSSVWPAVGLFSNRSTACNWSCSLSGEALAG